MVFHVIAHRLARGASTSGPLAFGAGSVRVSPTASIPLSAQIRSPVMTSLKHHCSLICSCIPASGASRTLPEPGMVPAMKRLEWRNRYSESNECMVDKPYRSRLVQRRVWMISRQRGRHLVLLSVFYQSTRQDELIYHDCVAAGSLIYDRKGTEWRGRVLSGWRSRPRSISFMVLRYKRLG